nr:inactive ribonuclease-like protein 9 [Dasypus novemcinctus]
MMWSLLSTRPLPLLLLLLSPLYFQVIAKESPLSDLESEELEDYINDFFATGPTREPTKSKFIRKTLLEPGRPLTDPYYCNDEIKNKNVHKYQQCVKEHYFLLTEYEEVQRLCHHLFVNCKDGIKGCNRSNKLIDGLYCKLQRGTRMPDCEYESFFRRGYVFITCQWQNEIHQLIPVTINDIMVPDV